jgi:hypothetical protein
MDKKVARPWEEWILKLPIEIGNVDCGMYFALVGVVMLFL